MSARILIIEDTEINLELMSYLLGAFGHTVTTAMDGELGVESARSDPPDLIVCDIQMPRMDGYEVARQLKEDAELSRIPLIAVTALAMVGDREKILAAGFEGYIPKPIDPEKFVGEIEEFLDPALRAAPRLAPAPSTESPARLPGKKRALLLVVDDSDMELWLMHSVFDPFGYDVRLAGNLIDALELGRALNPALIICDVVMPGGSGFDMLAAMKADPILCGNPVALITSVALGAAERERALAAGAVRFIARPIEPQDLLAEVEECLAELERR